MSPIKHLGWFIILILHGLGMLSLHAAPEPVRLFIAESSKPPKENTYWVGQKIPLIVEVLAPTHFSGPTRFSLPDVNGAVCYRAEQRAVVMSRNIDGTSYSVQRHEFYFYPLRPGSFRIPPISVRYGIAGRPGEKASDHQSETLPLEIQADLPDEAKGIHSLISTTKLQIKETWNPDPTKKTTTWATGNSIKRTLRISAEDVPGMALPHITIEEPPGLRVYRKRAQIDDSVNRGALTGHRTDSLTYLFQEAGDYTLPAITIHWWNIEQNKLNTITLPEINLTVVQAPQHASSHAKPPQSKTVPWLTLSWVSGVLLVLIFFLIRFQAKITSWIQCPIQHYRHRESAYFKRITLAPTATTTHQAIQQWQQKWTKLTPGQTLEQWSRPHAHDNLSQELQKLQYAIVHPGSDWNKTELIKELSLLRKQIKQQDRLTTNKSKPFKLKPLNPK
ncbi:BatD family protein [Verrucomicrobiaceae bacterium N1E253]|uniref:BatD family protein n=1 Tax=Oceaniferula marina TaxID=2748318 RepID=A0A851GBK9_9BACT|nr:BatD family protein [Oceaniferula marina]NWK55128.1 BatD family protein [Oceaniferula marina]